MSVKWLAVVRGVAFACVLFLIGFFAASSSGIANTLQMRTGETTSDAPTDYAPSGQVIPGRQLELVFVGASTCGASNRPGLPNAVETLKVRLEEYAGEREMSFRAVGIAVDLDTENGLDHLRRFGRFDEVSSGYGWGNAQAVRYMWSDSLVTPATPQILIYARTVGSPSEEASPLAVFHSEHDRELVAAVRGPNRITSVATAQSLEEGLRIHNLVRTSDPSPILRP